MQMIDAKIKSFIEKNMYTKAVYIHTYEIEFVGDIIAAKQVDETHIEEIGYFCKQCNKKVATDFFEAIEHAKEHLRGDY